MTNFVVISPKCCKESAERLSSLLDCSYLSAAEEDYSNYNLIINYGSSLPTKYRKIINSPKSVKICCNKISTLKRLANVCSTIEWTRELAKAREWLKADGAVVIRQLEEGRQGKGLIYAQDEATLINSTAKLYTRYFWHSNEIRINVFKNKILSVFDKVTNTERGEFEFIPLEIVGKEKQIEQMIEAIKNNIGIDYYGMDVLYNDGEYKLLEINSGPILLPQTEDNLIEEISKELV